MLEGSGAGGDPWDLIFHYSVGKAPHKDPLATFQPLVALRNTTLLQRLKNLKWGMGMEVMEPVSFPF